MDSVSSTQKRSIQDYEAKDTNSVAVDASIVLLDIEGTTTSISFVKDELFPYVTRNLKSYLSDYWETEQTQQDVEALYLLSVNDMKTGLEGTIPVLSKDKPKQDVMDSVIANVTWQMSSDRKSTELKQLQGHMWSNAYKTGEVKGHLYPEVSESFKKWRKDDKRVCIYSSGSVAAQKLLFSYSVDGDLTQHIEDYFDTNVGGKREPKSYTKISESLKANPSDIVFLTDVYEEAEAALGAGMSAVILIRPGNKPLSDEQRHKCKTIDNFNQLLFECNLEIPMKRKKDE